MPFSKLNLPFLSIFLFWVNASIHPVLCCYKTMFAFGDSITDTGNTISMGFQPCTANYPYGMTYFNSPNGRYSDGRVIIDFIAESQGLPYLPPYTNNDTQNFEHGVNFAIGGATALNQSFFEERNITISYAKYFLLVQLGWFKELLSSLCNSSTECEDVLSTSLIFLGEFGGDDYFWSLVYKRSPEIVRTYVPIVVGSISEGVRSLINLGAATIVVPGIFPMGCSSANLACFESSSKELYDELGCLIWFNELVEYHNDLLQKELDKLGKLYTNATIVYADYFKAVMAFYKDPKKFGFNKKPLVACCGEGGKYNFKSSTPCGPKSLHICNDPSSYVDWDGFHYTEKVYQLVAKAILSGEILSPSINISCSAFEQKKSSYFDQK